MNTTLHFSSDRQDWGTPPDFFERVADTWGPFDLDVCATVHNAKCSRYFTPDDNGLLLPWFGTCWMNPPYGDAVESWLQKARCEVLSGRADRVVALIAARTDTRWWHTHVMCCGNIVLLVRGRLKFEGAAHSAPFPSAVVVMTGKNFPLSFGAMRAKMK